MERYRAHSNLGSLAAMRGAFHEAYPHFESALTLARAAGPHADIAATLNNLAATAERIGEYPTAVKHFREGIELARRTGSLGHEGRMLVNLAVVFARLGELGPAWNTAAEAEDLAVQVDDPRLALSAAELQADVLRSCGMLAEAAGVMSKALDSAVAMNDERKALTLGAQLKTIEAVRGGERGPAVEAITALDDERLTDVAPWLWLELALAACDAPSATAFLGRVRRDDMSVHQRVVADIAAVRAGLLQGADGRCRVSADVAAARLQAPAPDVGSLARRPFVEKPLGTLVLAARAHAGRRQTVPSSFVVPEEVIADVKVQAEGLPRDMAERLREQPRHWLAALSGV
jgi:tetratricopeptide (TPR) repeat protein